MNQRELRGQQIAQKNNQITRVDEEHYQVKSQSRSIIHNIISTEFGWICSCEDHTIRKVQCKHIHAVEISLSIRKEVKTNVILEQVQSNHCIHCDSENFIKWNVRHNKNQDIQVYKCKDCSKYFSINLGFEGMHASPQVITSAMQLYFTGESLRNVQKFIKLRVEGVEKFKQVKPSLVIMDGDMPVLNGFEAFKQIMKIDNNANVVIVTGFSEFELKSQEAVKLGLIKVIAKPLRIDELLALAKKYTEIKLER